VGVRSCSIVNMIYLEGNQKLLVDDSYFALMPGERRTVEVGMLERVTDSPLVLSVRAINSSERRDLAAE
jgi:hypothetical protein